MFCFWFKEGQAGAELCQAQVKLEVLVEVVLEVGSEIGVEVWVNTILSFFWSPDAFKRVNIVKWNFLTFPKYQNKIFGHNLNSKFSTVPPHGGGV